MHISIGKDTHIYGIQRVYHSSSKSQTGLQSPFNYKIQNFQGLMFFFTQENLLY